MPLSSVSCSSKVTGPQGGGCGTWICSQGQGHGESTPRTVSAVVMAGVVAQQKVPEWSWSHRHAVQWRIALAEYLLPPHQNWVKNLSVCRGTSSTRKGPRHPVEWTLTSGKNGPLISCGNGPPTSGKREHPANVVTRRTSHSPEPVGARGAQTPQRSSSAVCAGLPGWKAQRRGALWRRPISGRALSCRVVQLDCWHSGGAGEFTVLEGEKLQGD